MNHFITHCRVVIVTAVTLTFFFTGTVSAQQSKSIATKTFSNISVSRENNVLLLQINTPPRNEVSKKTLTEIDNGLDIAATDETVGAVVITGSGTVFSGGAGGDGLKEIPPGSSSHAFIAHKIYNRIEGFPKPVIAAINGVSANGGNELAMSCDIRIAGESATFRQSELQVGLIPGFGGMQRLPRLIGTGRAMEMMLTGRIVNADEALAYGLVSSIVADNDLIGEAIALGQRLSQTLVKHSFAEFKKRLVSSYDEPFSVALQNDQLTFDRLIASEETRTAIAKFVEKMKKAKKK